MYGQSLMVHQAYRGCTGRSGNAVTARTGEAAQSLNGHMRRWSSCTCSCRYAYGVPADVQLRLKVDVEEKIENKKLLGLLKAATRINEMGGRGLLSLNTLVSNSIINPSLPFIRGRRERTRRAEQRVGRGTK